MDKKVVTTLMALILNTVKLNFKDTLETQKIKGTEK